MHKIVELLKEYKLYFGILIGIVLSSISVYAASTINSIDVAYSNTTSGLSSTNVKTAIDELYEKITKYCPKGELCSKIKLGDYVQMTPSSTSYTIPSSLTGYASDQTINPSELNLWRVIRINPDGTIDMVSEYISSKKVYFTGLKGYQNYIGTLKIIASQYENSTYTLNSRYMGYNGQTTFISQINDLFSLSGEQNGAGDKLYSTDVNLVEEALGTLVANNVNTTTAGRYWVASRATVQYNGTHKGLVGRFIWENGKFCNTSLGPNMCNDYNMYSTDNGNITTKNADSYLRPIVTLRTGLTPTGSGTSGDPYVLN